MRSHTVLRSFGLRPILLAALLSGCATTRVVDAWKDPAWSGPPLQKLLVCGLHADETFRRLLEDAFVVELGARGVKAEPCYQHVPTRPTEAQLHDAVARVAADGALVTYYAGERERTRYVPGYVGVSQGGWAPFYPSFGLTWDEVYSPGYLQTDIQVLLLTKVYLAADEGRLIWTGTSESLNPSSAQKLVSALVPRVIDSVTKAGVLPPK